jgi:hypothetical protein
VELEGVGLDGEEQTVELFASVPLSDESGWEPLEEGAVMAVRLGEVVASA